MLCPSLLVLTNPAISAEEVFRDDPVLLAVIRRPGCALCRREAGELSKLKEELDARGVSLIGIVHETLGVEEFRPFFQGPIYYDEKVLFNSFRGTELCLEALLWTSTALASNMDGILACLYLFEWPPVTQSWLSRKHGWRRPSTRRYVFKGTNSIYMPLQHSTISLGVYLINRDEMLYNHPERSWGDAANPKEVREALEKLPSIQTTTIKAV